MDDRVAQQTTLYRQTASLLAANVIRRVRTESSNRNHALCETSQRKEASERDASATPSTLESNNADAKDSSKNVDKAQWANELVAVQVSQYQLHHTDRHKQPHLGCVPASLVRRLDCNGTTSTNVAPLEDVSLPPPSVPPKQRQPTVWMPVCSECGAAYQPGVAGTTLWLQSSRNRKRPHEESLVQEKGGSGHATTRTTVTRSTRTARRRASRTKAKLLRAAQQRAKESLVHVSVPQQHVQRSNLWHFQDESNDISLLANHCCKNVAVITCGSCGQERIYPGMDNPKPHTKMGRHEPHHNRHSQPESAARKKARANNGATVAVTTARHATTLDSSRGAVVASAVESTEGEDFVALPSRHPQPPFQSPPRTAATGSLLNPPRKKKEPKNKSKGGGNPALLSFLSSLND